MPSQIQFITQLPVMETSKISIGMIQKLGSKTPLCPIHEYYMTHQAASVDMQTLYCLTWVTCMEDEQVVLGGIGRTQLIAHIWGIHLGTHIKPADKGYWSE